jgi:catechol 2,3-dioxygenase-like lactoylglutathione lyase family enzyme
MTGVRALWLPYRVEDLDAARDFYTVHLGLSEVDRWERPHERGTVLRAAGAAFIELVAPAAGPSQPDRRSRSGPAPSTLAFELPDERAVDAAFGRWPRTSVLAAPHRYPRGHYGFEVAGPAAAQIMVWSEK